jgi:hypothetical protein
MKDLLPHLPAVPPVLYWIAGLLLAWRWLRRELTPRRVLSIFETDGVLSARQLLAWVLAVFGMCMLAAGRLNVEGLSSLLGWVVGLFGIGGIVKAAAAVKPAATVNAAQADVHTRNTTINSTTAPTITDDAPN